MNTSMPSTPAPEGATPIDWSAEFDGQGGLADRVVELKHLLRFLDADLDFCFDRNRGRVRGASGIDFTFNDDTLEATQWLAGYVSSLAIDLCEHVEKLHTQFIEGPTP